MITKSNNSLSEIFDVNPVTGEVINPPVIQDTGNDADDDFKLARATMQNLLLKGQNSLEVACLVATSVEDPKCFDAVSKMITSISDVTDKLMSLHEKKQKIKSKVEVEPGNTAPGVTCNGPVFIGTTSELSKLLTQSKSIKSNE